VIKGFFAGKASKPIIGLLVAALVVGGISAQASGVLNTPSGGYLLCVNSKTKVITHPGTTNCPKGSKKLTIGASGKDGKTLWNGEKDPENTLGSPGDIFINSVTKTLFGPKNLDGTWPAGVSMIGPTGATGPQGPGGGGSVGPAGPAGSNATLTCAQGGTCALGDTGPGGGKVFIVQTPTAAAPWRYMEAAPNTWSGGIADPPIKWCSVTNQFVPNLLTGNRVTVQTSTAIGAGYSNTQKMLRACAYGAANAAASYNGGGKSDWHLPSLGELHQLCLSRTYVGGFWPWDDGGAIYVTSSEKPLNNPLQDVVYAEGFGQNQCDTGGETLKSVELSVRPVRAF
jgi:hypothetical protein